MRLFLVWQELDGFSCSRGPERHRPPMIISFILGGLGNQFFQYALGRQLPCLQESPLKIETAGYAFPKYAHHPYLLDRFNITADRARAVDYVALAAGVFRGSVVTL